MKCGDLTSTNILIITLESSFHDHRQLPGWTLVDIMEDKPLEALWSNAHFRSIL